MSVGSVTLKKNERNMVGISIGGGAPHCPVLYVVQVFDKSPAGDSGLILPGDELTAVNERSVKGFTKAQVAKRIQGVGDSVTLYYNRLTEECGRPADIVWKTIKHKLVESMNPDTADSLGFSRAILVKDRLVQKVLDFESSAKAFSVLVCKLQAFMLALRSTSYLQKVFGDVLAEIGVKSTQPDAHRALTLFGSVHRDIGKSGMNTANALVTVLKDLGTFLGKAVPDMKLTLKKYANTKFNYLSFCLKVKEMDDEDYYFITCGEPLPRLLSGNYHYRQILRERHKARIEFKTMRSAVTSKLEFMELKRVQDISFQLERLMRCLFEYYKWTSERLRDGNVFPIEVNLDLSMPFAQTYTEECDDDGDGK